MTTVDGAAPHLAMQRWIAKQRGLSGPMVKGLEYYARVLAEGRVDPQWQPPRVETQVALIERGLLTIAPHQLTGLGEIVFADLFPWAPVDGAHPHEP